MTYDEYLKCAEKHLNGCCSLLSSYKSGQKDDMHVWLELYYLSGYIIEGIVVYSAYKLFNWPPNEDIKKRYNVKFSQQTNLDYYYERKFKGNVPVPNFFQNRPHGALSVQGHKFQEIVKVLLRPDPSFQDTPYIGNGQIDSDIEGLIDDWKPEIRYWHTVNHPQNLSKVLITRLIDTCKDIYKKHI